MSPGDRVALRKLAKRADMSWYEAQIQVGHNPIRAEHVGEYIAAASPTAILALLADYEAGFRAGIEAAAKVVEAEEIEMDTPDGLDMLDRDIRMTTAIRALTPEPTP